MHTMWKGSISFGLVNVPVKMFAATEDKDIKFKYLHDECGTPVKNIRTCPTCDRTIEWSEVVKGYEHQPGQYVLMKDEDFEKVLPQKTKTIDILNFVELPEIDPIYFNKSYYLAPEDTSSKAYALLRKAMEESGKIAVAKMVIRSTQSLCVLRTYEGVIVMESIFYPDEVRAVTMIPSVPADVEVAENEMNVAVKLIESLTVQFEPEQYRNEYRERLLHAIEEKIEGHEITEAAEPKPDQMHDLMAALQASLNVKRPEAAERPVAVGETATGDADGANGATDAEGANAPGLSVVQSQGEDKPKRRRRRTSTE
ncbi:MAG TPA: Ku protein [Bacilli bacterium]|nr:Ku protein [Bacilli bacterium]